MASKVLIDANVLLDFTLKRDNYPLARQLFNAVVDQKLNAYITPSILHIVGYWLKKTFHFLVNNFLFFIECIFIAQRNHLKASLIG